MKYGGIAKAALNSSTNRARPNSLKNSLLPFLFTMSGRTRPAFTDPATNIRYDCSNGDSEGKPSPVQTAAAGFPIATNKKARTEEGRWTLLSNSYCLCICRSFGGGGSTLLAGGSVQGLSTSCSVASFQSKYSAFGPNILPQLSAPRL